MPEVGLVRFGQVALEVAQATVPRYRTVEAGGGGVRVAELIRQVGITEQTDQVRQFKQSQEESAQLKRPVAEVTLDKTMLQDVRARNM